MKYGFIKNYGAGTWLDSDASTIDVHSPLDDSLIAQIYDSSAKDLENIVDNALIAQKEWGVLTLKHRAQIAYNYRKLLIKHRDDLAIINQCENGKSLSEAYAGIDKAIELTEFACSIPQIATGEIEMVSNGVVCRNEKRPLGVVACITPFNFPVMVPHWTIPNAIVLGNAVILKPSEFTPISAAYIANLWKEAGLPDGIFNVVNGSKDIVEAICDQKDIKAISFVGSTPVAKIVYQRATNKLKRVLTLGGAKNHLIIAPDAVVESSARDIVASVTGMSGQRCMAASVMILINGITDVLDEVVRRMMEQVPGDTIPPLISKEAVKKVVEYLENAEKLGAKILVDGRKFEDGYLLGGSIIDWRDCPENMPPEEVFGPVLEVISVPTLEDALSYQAKSPYGNACSIFTQNGRVSETMVKHAEAGMLGVNIGVPVPREPFSFGGIKNSKYGMGDITGKESFGLWTDTIKITTKWNTEDQNDWMS